MIFTRISHVFALCAENLPRTGRGLPRGVGRRWSPPRGLSINLSPGPCTFHRAGPKIREPPMLGPFFRYFHMILDVCAENLPSRFSHDFRRVCRELAENLPSHTTPVSIAALLRPRDVRPDLPRGVGRRWSPPGGFQLN